MGNKGKIRFAAIMLSILLAGNAYAAAAVGSSNPLAANTAYTIILSQLTSAGALQDLETVNGTTDADGVLSFTLTQVPSKDDANFVFVTIKDAGGNVVRQGMAPAPPPGDNNATGLNYLSTTQAEALIRAASIIGSDDPIVGAYLFIILRSPEITPADIDNVAYLGADALTNPTLGFESYLLAHGVSQAKLETLKKCLIYNPDENAKTLRNFARNFFNAVATDNEATASSEMQKAGGFMAEVFLDAGTCSGVEAGQILAAHNAAGDGADAGGHFTALSANLKASIETAMTTFNRRISIIRISTDYTNALNALNGSGDQVTQYLSGVAGLMQTSSEVDIEYAGYFMDRQAYLDAHPGVTDADVQQAINDAYSAGWTQFQAAIAADNASLDAMKATLLSSDPSLNLPGDFGTYYDQNGTPQNWPVPQVVLVSWLAGSTFDYGPRDNTAIPAIASISSALVTAIMFS